VFDKRTRRFFVSDTGDGTIYRGTLGSGTMEPFITGSGAPAVGLEIRRRFLNDLAVTGRGDVFVTDSFRPTVWHVTPAQVRAGSGDVEGLDVSGGIPFDTTEGVFNLNGIVARTGHKLVVVDSNTGKLFRIALSARRDGIRRIDAIEGVTVKGGDGMILDRGRLVVVQGDPAELHFVKLRRGLRRAADNGTQTSDKLVGPSTIARARKLYLVVNAHFSAPTVTPDVVGLPRNRGGRGR
jgi:hypothetical protein